MAAFRYASKIERDIVSKAGRAVCDYGLIAEGDRILVAVSGGKDSLTLLEVLRLLARRAPCNFSFSAVTIDPGYPGFSAQRVVDHCQALGYDHALYAVPIAQIVKEKLAKETSPCGLCSRIRRGALYSYAYQHGFTKIALGHHLDDLLETFLMNVFFSGSCRAMAPTYRSDDGRNVIIRPLALVPESLIKTYVASRGFKTATCDLDVCGVGPDSRRLATKHLITTLAEKHPGVRSHMLKALKNVRTEHLLDLRFLSQLPTRASSSCDADSINPVTEPNGQ